MKSWQIALGVILILSSTLVYGLQIVIFQNPHDTFFYLLQDLAFVPIQVLLITLLLNHLLGLREKKVLLNKMNMLIGLFFSEVGTDLLKSCFEFDNGAKNLKKILLVDSSWDDNKFRITIKAIKQHSFTIDESRSDLNKLQKQLQKQRSFLMGLLANPNLLEHDDFTDLMWAVFHLAEELDFREDFMELPNADYAHLGKDISRAYGLLVREWLVYMSYLRKYYPYLFSLAVRNNPFNDNRLIIIPDNK